jgi:aspartyl-tRNA(Asn)/glutamyl-tRNA(Gln) amidotransferase subunit C
MKKAEIEHLASLSRIRLSEAELNNFESELSSIMTYVSTVSNIVADESDVEPKVGAVNNVFRKDEITNEPNQFSEDILHEMPEKDGRYLQVKKILQTED